MGIGTQEATVKRNTLLFLFLLLALSGLNSYGQEGLETFSKLQSVIEQVSERIKPTVVHIEVIASRNNSKKKGLGSGLIVSEDGKIITNHHVIANAEHITVILDDKSRHKATLERDDEQTDLALLKLDDDGPFPYANFGNSDQVKVGEWVVAIGNPFGFDRTVSFGIISGKGRYIPDNGLGQSLINDFIQTDALIDPGSSGGPLINLKGEVVGINSVGIGRGQGFTIPAKIVHQLMTRKEKDGKILRGWIGVFLHPVSPELASHLKLPADSGIMVEDLFPKSPALKAGLQPGDIIVRLNGEPVAAEQETEINRFAQQVGLASPGDTIALDYYRQGKLRSAKVKVLNQPESEIEPTEVGAGISVAPISYNSIRKYRLSQEEGVVIVDISHNSAAKNAELDEGDIILTLNGQAVNNVEDLEALLEKNKDSNTVLIKVLRGRLIQFGLLDFEKFGF